MPDRLSREQWEELMTTEADTFRLAIRSWAAIEAEIDAYGEALFRAPLKNGMRSIGSINTRIAVASALGVIPQEILPALRELQEIRNDFAHGDIHDP